MASDDSVDYVKAGLLLLVIIMFALIIIGILVFMFVKTGFIDQSPCDTFGYDSIWCTPLAFQQACSLTDAQAKKEECFIACNSYSEQVDGPASSFCAYGVVCHKNGFLNRENQGYKFPRCNYCHYISSDHSSYAALCDAKYMGFYCDLWRGYGNEEVDKNCENICDAKITGDPSAPLSVHCLNPVAHCEKIRQENIDGLAADPNYEIDTQCEDACNLIDTESLSYDEWFQRYPSTNYPCGASICDSSTLFACESCPDDWGGCQMDQYCKEGNTQECIDACQNPNICIPQAFYCESIGISCNINTECGSGKPCKFPDWFESKGWDFKTSVVSIQIKSGDDVYTMCYANDICYSSDATNLSTREWSSYMSLGPYIASNNVTLRGIINPGNEYNKTFYLVRVTDLPGACDLGYNDDMFAILAFDQPGLGVQYDGSGDNPGKCSLVNILDSDPCNASKDLSRLFYIWNTSNGNDPNQIDNFTIIPAALWRNRETATPYYMHVENQEVVCKPLAVDLEDVTFSTPVTFTEQFSIESIGIPSFRTAFPTENELIIRNSSVSSNAPNYVMAVRRFTDMSSTYFPFYTERFKSGNFLANSTETTNRTTVNTYEWSWRDGASLCSSDLYGMPYINIVGDGDRRIVLEDDGARVDILMEDQTVVTNKRDRGDWKTMPLYAKPFLAGTYLLIGYYKNYAYVIQHSVSTPGEFTWVQMPNLSNTYLMENVFINESTIGAGGNPALFLTVPKDSNDNAILPEYLTPLY